MIAALVFALGFWFRFNQLGQNPVGLYWDETAILVDARALAATSHDMHGNSWLQAIFPSYGDYKLPVYIWLASLSVKAFGASEWTLRLPSAIAGLGTMLVVGLLMWELWPNVKAQQRRWLGLLAALIMAVTPWSILFSRTGFEGHVGQFLLALSLWLALKMSKAWSWAMFSALVGGLATYSYFSIRFVWPVVFLAIGILFFKATKKWSWWRQAILLLASLGIYALTLWPMVKSPLYPASNQFRLSAVSIINMADWPVVANEYRLKAGNTIFDKALYHPVVLMGRELLKNYADNLSADFLFFKGDPNLRHGTGRHGLFLWVFLPAFVYGWYKFWPKYWRQGLLLLIWWLVALLPASVPETTPHALRSLNALVPLTIVISWGCWQLWQSWWQTKHAKLTKNLVAGVVLLIGALTVFDFASDYFFAYPARSAADWQDGYKQLASEAWSAKDQMDVVWIDPFDSRFYLWLMAYHLEPERYASLTYENYMPSAIDNIRFRWFDWGKLPTLSEQTLVIAKKDYLDWKLTETPYPPTWYKTFYRTDGLPEFAAIYFEKRP